MNAVQKAKVLFSSNPENKIKEEQSFVPKATVLFSGETNKKVPLAEYKPAALFQNPTIRKRMKIDVETLKEKYPSVSENAILLVEEFLHSVNVCQFSDQDALNWGYECQEEYTSLIEKIADIANSSVIKASKFQINEIGIIIEKDFRKPSFWAGMLGRKKAKSTEDIYKSLTIKNELLKNLIPELIKLLDESKERKNDIFSLENRVMVESIAAEMILDKVKAEYKSVLETRITSLVSMNIQFKMAKKQIEIIEQMIRDIISIIQDTLSVEIPFWYSNKTLENLNEEQKSELLKKLKI